MELAQLKKIAERRRYMREGGIALALAGGVLALFLIVPIQGEPPRPALQAETETPGPDAFASIPLEAKAAIVYDLSTNKVLFARNENAQLPLASLTKLLTVYAALDTLMPSTEVTIPPEVASLEAPHAFSPGETLSFNDLARLTLTASLNDGATAIAEAAAHARGDSTSTLLAGAAAALDLSQTFAVNGSGLDVNTEISGGYGSARDVAVLAGALVSHAPEIAAATTEPSVKGISLKGVVHTAKNTDPMVGTLPHLLLSKTGYTDLAGGNLALVIDVGINHPVAIVVLGSSKESRFTDGQTLAAATLAHFAGLKSL